MASCGCGCFLSTDVMAAMYKTDSRAAVGSTVPKETVVYYRVVAVFKMEVMAYDTNAEKKHGYSKLAMLFKSELFNDFKIEVTTHLTEPS